MHLDAGFANPLLDNFELNNLRRGISRELGCPPKQMLPITCQMLQQLIHCLDFNDCADVSFWAACTTAFFGFLRKATLLPSSPCYPGIACLLRGDLHLLSASYFELHVRRTKTIQFNQRVLVLPYSAAQGSPLCPVKALYDLIHLSSFSDESPLFSYKKGKVVCWWTHSTFVCRLRSLLSDLGFDPKSYSGHSFRRGGASLGFKLGLSILQIKQRGDWRSSAVESYIEIDGSQRADIANALVLGASALLST